MYRFITLMISGLMVGIGLPGQTIGHDQPIKLVVGIVVDQMRFDQLEIYQDRFASNGFRRMTGKGFSFRNAHCDYIPTVTAVGHATVYTGAMPGVHGIIGNSWFERESGIDVGNVDDTTEQIVGSWEQNINGISPRRLLTSTISDQLRMSNNFKSRVISISFKDRGAVLPGGHTANGAFWHDWRTSPGYFVSSSYYMDELPDWVDDFNERGLSRNYLDTVWNTLYPIDTYLSGEDNSKYERALRGKTAPVFPYDFRALSEVYRSLDAEYQLLWVSPAGNTLLTEFAMAAIDGEQLGADEFPDLLNISYSVTDVAGHTFGLQSVELEDIYLRLDLEIARLLTYLDETIGEGSYVVFLTSDHGAIQNASFLYDRKLPAGIAYINEYKEKLEEYLQKKYGEGRWITQFEGAQLYLNRDTIFMLEMDLASVQRDAAGFLLNLEGISMAVTAEDLNRNEYRSGIRRLLQNGYHPKRSGDVLLSIDPGYIQSSNPKTDIISVTGTTHGSGYAYDTHVPIVWYGSRIAHGSSVRKVSITDISPTIAMMLNLQLPEGNTGVPLNELFEQ